MYDYHIKLRDKSEWTFEEDTYTNTYAGRDLNIRLPESN